MDTSSSFFAKLLSKDTKSSQKHEDYIDELNKRLSQIKLLSDNHFNQQKKILKDSNIVINFDYKLIPKNELEDQLDNKLLVKSVNNEVESDKKSICKKLLQSNKIIKSIFNTINTNIGEYFKDASKNVSQFSSDKLQLILDNTIGRVFKWVSGPARTLFNTLNVIVNPIFSAFTWLKDKAINVIGFVFTSFKKLAEVGWDIISNVFEVITTPIKEVSSFLFDSFLSLLESPTFFTAFVVSALGGLYFFGPTITKYLGKLLTTIWDLVKTVTAKLFFSGNNEKMNKFFEDSKNKLFGFIDDMLSGIVQTYDGSSIRKSLGLPDYKTIVGYFSRDGIIVQTWNWLINKFIPNITDIMNDALLTWNMIRDVYYYVKSWIGGEDADVAIQRINVQKENEQRLSSVSKDALQDHLNNYLMKSLSEFYMRNIGVIRPELMHDVLMDKGNMILSSFSSKFKKDNVEFGKVLDSVNVNIGSLVGRIETSGSDVTKIMDDYTKKSLESSQKLSMVSDLYTPETQNNIDLLKNKLNDVASYKTDLKITDNVLKALQEKTDFINGKLEKVSYDTVSLIYNYSQYVDRLNDNQDDQIIFMKNLDKLFENSEDYRVKTIIELYKKRGKIFNNIEELKQQIAIDQNDIGLTPLHKKILEKAQIDELKAFAKKYENQAIVNEVIPNAANPINELFKPEKTIDFSNIFKLSDVSKVSEQSQNTVLKEETYNIKIEDVPSTQSQQVMQRVIKSTKTNKPNLTIFDMKNLSNGVISPAR